ncbi:MAG: hypothetical protein KatS3mg023_4016 [Armatimonadota bacterium]|nr:MAG: hypothetical protein KatS3mg023_4016 [Armatimonadota bacterium]GIV94478.1 MAG: hypothetical protein KatS3mg056_3187 [Chloroflexus sp.]
MATEADLSTKHRHGVVAALTLSYAQLTPEHDAAALSLFHRLAWLAPLPIPEALLTALSDGQSPDPALRGLRVVGLIDRYIDRIQLHRLITAFGRERDPEPTATLSDTVTAVLAVIGDQDLDRMPLAGTPHRPHLEELCRHADRLADVLAARLLMKTGWLLDIQGAYAAARPLYERVLAICERSLGPDHPDTVQSLTNLAGVLEAQGKYAAARPLYERVLTIVERNLGPDHPQTAASLTDLAECLQAQGKYAAARPLYERALAIYERSLGPDHPQTAASLTDLAVCLEAQGEYTAARPLLERALAIYERSLGPNHPQTAASMTNLAGLFYAQEKYAAARPLFERALAIYERSFGPDHPDVATTLNNLAVCLWAQGKYAAARPLLERALAIYERSLGPDHPQTRLMRKQMITLRNSDMR